jgi:DNA polymerase-3 subunit chi
VFVYCQHEEDAIEMDELLWSFEQTSFIPHNLQGEGPHAKPPVQIGYGHNAQGFHDILINLSMQVPVFCQKFNRVCEIVLNDEEYKQEKRQSFRIYKEQNFSIQTHQIR